MSDIMFLAAMLFLSGRYKIQNLIFGLFLLLSVESLLAQNLSSPKAPSEDFNIPLRFDVLGDAVKMQPLVFDYEVIDHLSLKISDVEFNQNSFFVGIFSTKKLSPVISKINNFFESKKEEEWLFLARWPKIFIQNGILEAINRSGRIVWKTEITNADLESWAQQLESWKKTLRSRKVEESIIQRISLFSTSFGIRDFAAQRQPFWTLQEPFRFCISSEKEDGQYTRVCSQLLEVGYFKKNEIALREFPVVKKQAKIIAFNSVAQPKDSKIVKPGEPVQFYVELGNGASYEFFSKPLRFNLVEMLEHPDHTELAAITAWGARPSIDVEEIPQEKRSFLDKLVGQAWGQTIGDFREFWQVSLSRKNPKLSIPGDGGGVFRVQFDISKLPSEKIRPWVASNTVEGTYIDGPRVYGLPAKGTSVSSNMNSLEMDKSNSNEFIWEFGAKKPGMYNKSYLLVQENGETFKAYREIYRGFGREISARLSALLATGGNFIFMGETAFNYWFENIFGWDNHYLSRQRWGASIKYFKSLNNVTIGTVNNTIEYTNFDLKYRFDAGLWSRDETWGAQLSSTNVIYESFNNQMYGLGLFWARSLPKVFNDVFDKFPFMKYPKWVDMEFIYYPVTTTPRVGLFNIGQGYGNWQLNFHGKVMWGKQFFGEAGFGLKQLDFRQFISSSGSNLRLQFTSFHGTVGVGWSF